MWLALKAHYAAHPGEPFDHEKHMPTHMKEARSDPATWASGSGAGGSGAGGSGTLSPEAKAAVVAELKSLIEPKEESVVTLRTKKPSLVHALSDPILLLLDAKNVEQARNPKASVKWGPAFLANLKSCLAGADGAFPGYRIEKNTKGAEICGRTDRFTGDYILGLALKS